MWVFMCMFVNRSFHACYKPAARSQCFACGLIIVIPGWRVDELWFKKKDRKKVNESLVNCNSQHLCQCRKHNLQTKAICLGPSVALFSQCLLVFCISLANWRFICFHLSLCTLDCVSDLNCVKVMKPETRLCIMNEDGIHAETTASHYHSWVKNKKDSTIKAIKCDKAISV